MALHEAAEEADAAHMVTAEHVLVDAFHAHTPACVTAAAQTTFDLEEPVTPVATPVQSGSASMVAHDATVATDAQVVEPSVLVV